MWQYSAAHSRHSRNSRQKNLRKNPRNPPLVVQNGQIHDEDLPSLQSMMSCKVEIPECDYDRVSTLNGSIEHLRAHVKAA